MDDEADRSYARAPEQRDLIDLCRRLNQEGVRYLLIGGFAVILHGFVRSTKDIDLLVDVSPENIRALKRAMAGLPDNAISLIDDDEVDRYDVVRVADEFVVDLMKLACGLDFEAASAMGVDRIDIDGIEIPIASKRALIAMKQTVRPSDASDVEFLRLRLGDEDDAMLLATHPNTVLINRFYTAFAARDHATMAACYHPAATFRDPVFTLEGERIGQMWHMLCERGEDLVVRHRDVEADDVEGRAHWAADYTFGATGRKVHNEIDAEFRFRDGLIVEHIDRFDFHRWARQALGPVGLLLGWTPWLRGKVRRQAGRGLERFASG